MSEEEAFLAALKANPVDDTTRLVYADWLDEHAEPQKAEYLRLVAALAQRGSTLLESPEVQRAIEITAALDQTWRVSAGARFAMVLIGFSDKIRAIKAARELTGMGLGEAKGFVECAPSRFKLRLTLEEACGVSRYLHCGTVAVDTNCYATDPAVAVTLDASVDLLPKVWEPPYTPPPESVRAFLDFLVATGHLTRAKASKLRHAESRTLATDLQVHQLEEQVRAWRGKLAPTDAAKNWEIVFCASFRTQPER